MLVMNDLWKHDVAMPVIGGWRSLGERNVSDVNWLQASVKAIKCVRAGWIFLCFGSRLVFCRSGSDIFQSNGVELLVVTSSLMF